MLDILLDFCAKSDVEYKVDMDLSEISPIGIGAGALLYVLPNTKEKLIGSVDFAQNKGIKNTVVGGMSNLLPLDSRYNGVVISTKRLNKLRFFDKYVKADAGVYLPRLINFAKSNRLGGAEALFGIPGTVGGAVYSNAGAFGSSISDFFVSGEFYDSDSRELITLNSEEVGFSYRYSILKERRLICINVLFEFFPSNEAAVDAKIKGICARRNETQPTGQRSLGSVFKRSNGIGAGYYIDRCGLRGARCGGAEISEKHAGFIINRGGATAKDYLTLVEIAKREVKLKFGIELETEIEIME